MSTFRLHPTILMTTNVGVPAGMSISTSTSMPPLLVEDERLPWAILALDTLGAFSEDDAKRTWRSKPQCREVVDDLWDYCLAEELVVPTALHDAGVRLPAYHRATRSHPFLFMERAESFLDDNGLMKEYLEADDYPPLSLDLEARATTPLTKVEAQADLQKARRDLSTVFDGTFGVRAQLRHEVKADGYLQLAMYFKSIPSGGSRHPTECFVHIHAFGGLSDGLHHYNPATNSLDAVSDVPREALDMTLRVRPASAPCAPMVVILASAVERAMWRYRESRSLRAVLIDAGHAEEMFATLAGYVGWRVHRVLAFDPDAVAALLPVSQPLPVLAVLEVEVDQ